MNPIIPANLQHLREKAVEKFDLTHDVMRHTYISMFVAKFRSIGEAALQAGNFVLFDVQEVTLHIRTKLKVPARG